MKKILLGLTLITSISSFAGDTGDKTHDLIQSRGLDALASIYTNYKQGNFNNSAMAEFDKLMDKANDKTQECLTVTRNLILTYGSQKVGPDEELFTEISSIMDSSNDETQNCLTSFRDRILP